MSAQRPGAGDGLFGDKLELLERLLAEEGLGAPAVERVAPRTVGEEPVLSFAQQRMWFLHQWDPQSPNYLIAEAFELRGELRAELLRQAAGEVVRRHEVLRTAFVSAAGRPQLLVAPYAALRMPVIDLTALPAEWRQSAAAALTTGEGRRPFDLAVPPLLRLTLLRLAGDTWVLLVTLHHIVADGWSIGVLIRETMALYSAALAVAPSPLSELPIQYADFAAWQRRFLEGEELERQLAFWRRSLEGAPEILELPTDRPRPALRSPRGRTLKGELPAALAAELREAGRRSGASLFMVLLAAWQVILARHAGQRDFAVGTPIANRTRSEIEGLIGFFANTLALRSCLGGDPTFAELLARVRAATLEAYDHQDLPFERLVEELGLGRSTSHAPLFQVMLAMQDAGLRRLALAGLRVESLGVDRGTAKLDLTLGIEDGEGGLRTSWELSADLFDEATIERLREGFTVLLTAVAADPGARVFEAPLLAAAERREILAASAVAAAGPYALAPLHRAFEARAARAPERLALSFAGQGLTYRELDRRANAVARRLRDAGVGPGQRVGLLFQRSFDLVIALLGVLKAGGAYVPLDPDYPAERLAFVLADARPVAVLGGGEAEGLTAVAGTVLRLAGLDGGWEGAEGEPLAGGATLGDPAYVIYTSGSTGRPKGVLVPHANVVRLFAATDPWFGFGAGRRLDPVPLLRLRLLRVGAVGRAAPRRPPRRRPLRSEPLAARTSASCSPTSRSPCSTRPPRRSASSSRRRRSSPRRRPAPPSPPCATWYSAAKRWSCRASLPGSTVTATPTLSSSTCTASPRPPCMSPGGRSGAPISPRRDAASSAGRSPTCRSSCSMPPANSSRWAWPERSWWAARGWPPAISTGRS